MANDKHKTTMTSFQRKELVRILKPWHKIEDLVLKTDPQLHELWLIDCEYPNVYEGDKM